ncbi:MAG: hypothetical protein GEV03_10150 [Streptosporangiales bacterium]|nr:hypothetical protein [Streptosporangiales bacterium]
MGRIDGLLDPELKNRLRAALDPLAKPADDDDPRTTGQSYANTALCCPAHNRYKTATPTGSRSPDTQTTKSPTTSAAAPAMPLDAPATDHTNKPPNRPGRGGGSPAPPRNTRRAGRWPPPSSSSRPPGGPPGPAPNSALGPAIP